MKLHLYDAMNWIRVELHQDITGRYPRRLLNQMSAKSMDVHLWVWDGPGNKDKRLAVFPGYKEGRPSEGEDFWAFVETIRKVLSHSHAFQVSVPGYEADDVIATLARRYRERCDVHIYSTDRDFTQLNCEGIRTSCEPEAGVDPSDVRLYKTLVGDKSDRIPGLRGFGRKSWDKLSAENRRELVRALCGEDYDPHRTGLSDRHIEHIGDLKVFWQIIDFFDVPVDLIDKHVSRGDGNFDAADEYLKRYLQ